MFIIFFLFSFFVHAQELVELELPVVDRSQSGRPVIEPRTLTHLFSADYFSGKYFKIVKGKTDEPISIHDEEEILLKAATTYFHLMKARQYFIDVLKSNYVENLPVITVRLEIKNQFNELGHFANDNLDPEYNNALTIPGGKSFRGDKTWNTEIWFRPKLKRHLSELNVKNTNGSLKSIFKQFRNQSYMMNLSRFLSSILQSPKFPVEQSIRLVGATLLLEMVYQTSPSLEKAFSRKWFWLDSALVPEIIYHEFSHVGLSDYLELSHSTPVIEGMADYFAGKISANPKLAKKIKKYNTFNGKNAKNKKNYQIQFESSDYANTDFVFGMLWSLDPIWETGKEAEAIYVLRSQIDTNSPIRSQFIEGLLKICRTNCKNKTTGRDELFFILHKRGF
jgi:hypothetical protein